MANLVNLTVYAHIETTRLKTLQSKLFEKCSNTVLPFIRLGPKTLRKPKETRGLEGQHKDASTVKTGFKSVHHQLYFEFAALFLA